MKEIEIDLHGNADDEAIQRAVERACSSARLRCTLKDTLRAYPGCVHWHFKNGTQRGTLEITYWPQQTRAWFSIQAGRSATWIDDVLPAIHKSLAEQL